MYWAYKKSMLHYYDAVVVEFIEAYRPSLMLPFHGHRCIREDGKVRFNQLWAGRNCFLPFPAGLPAPLYNAGTRYPIMFDQHPITFTNGTHTQKHRKRIQLSEWDAAPHERNGGRCRLRLLLFHRSRSTTWLHAVFFSSLLRRLMLSPWKRMGLMYFFSLFPVIAHTTECWSLLFFWPPVVRFSYWYVI